MNFVTPINNADEKDVEGNVRELVRRGNRSFGDEGDSGTTGYGLSAWLDRMSEASICELEGLIGELQILRDKLYADRNHLQRGLAEYATRSQSVIQLTKIVSESVKRIPGAPLSTGF